MRFVLAVLIVLAALPTASCRSAEPGVSARAGWNKGPEAGVGFGKYEGFAPPGTKFEPVAAAPVPAPVAPASSGPSPLVILLGCVLLAAIVAGALYVSRRAKAPKA